MIAQFIEDFPFPFGPITRLMRGPQSILALVYTKKSVRVTLRTEKGFHGNSSPTTTRDEDPLEAGETVEGEEAEEDAR
jgi:hypothetical protein